MTAIATTFDSLECCEVLKDAGMPEPQAKAQAAILQKAFQAQNEDVRKVSENTARETVNSMRADLREELATKGDIADVKSNIRETELRLQKDIKEVELRLQKEIEVVRREIQQSKHEMIRWYIGMTVALAGVFVGVLATFYAVIR